MTTPPPADAAIYVLADAVQNNLVPAIKANIAAKMELAQVVRSLTEELARSRRT